MSRFAAALDRATRQKFRHMADTALYFTDPAAANPLFVQVCITDRFLMVGDLKGTNFNYAEIEAESPIIEFLIEQVDPVQNAYVSVRPGLAYQIDTVLPTEGICRTVRAARVPTSKLRNFPVPDATNATKTVPQTEHTWAKEEW